MLEASFESWFLPGLRFEKTRRIAIQRHPQDNTGIVGTARLMVNRLWKPWIAIHPVFSKCNPRIANPGERLLPVSSQSPQQLPD
jgi:hypothetical protein